MNLCKDCTHIVPYKYNPLPNHGGPYCNHPNADRTTDPVYGDIKLTNVLWMRDSKYKCGPQGNWFEAKPVSFFK